MESGKELISKELNDRLSKILGECFYLNRVLDRGISLLEVRWKLLNTAKVIHPSIAHTLPLLGDKISEFQSKRNCESIYPDTIGGLKEYGSPIEFFEFVLEEFNRFEDEIYDTISYAAMEKDYASKQFLQSFLSEFEDYIATMNNIVDVANAYSTSSDSMAMQLFDNEIEHCLTIPNLSEVD